MREMKAVTLTQPWATLVAIGAKQIETRSWPTNYRGPLAIHAGKGPSTIGWPQLNHICNRTEPFRSVLQLGGRHPAEALPTGAIVAVCRLVGVVPTEMIKTHSVWVDAIPGTTAWNFELTDQERAFGDYSDGRFAWLLADVRRLPAPIPARGALGLWDWTPQEGMQL